MVFTYKKLDLSQKEFRLLEIQPSLDDKAPIEARLTTVKESCEVQYIAISSPYGDPNEKERITVNNRPVIITSHLASALRNVRALFFPVLAQHFQDPQPIRRPRGAPRWLKQLVRVGSSIAGGGAGRSSNSTSSKGSNESGSAAVLRVWVDMICVNQSSDVEKSQQHSTIRQIYRNAELVVGWLGDKIEQTDLGLGAIAEVDEIMPERWGEPGDQEENPEDYAPTHRWAKAAMKEWLADVEGLPPNQGPAWVGATDILLRPYFQRRWLLEELAEARYPAFLIGDVILPWKQVLRVFRFIEEFKYQESEIFPKELQDHMALLPLESTQKLMDEFSRKQAREEAKILAVASSRATTSSASTK
ncbi:hypothetical protein MCOR25_009859 [Pyricularia grisea]|uniref:Heterokaryon incompatibility domain-containing protein n=1 Tax=Pyricularia grisea TaxID=148305 RepID=A0A6P8AR63_PYRGI|nr:uncharacterized protein PgNI_12217 [Pyricularia grisea]KAI6351576.1 hypothetical protein MCOR25_009859 [Pyricularia grisea]TLD04544.1 hypothetical protein PgNI_12217 [Pyricularia grisea]